MLESESFHVSMGEMPEVFEIRWMFCLIELKPALIESVSEGEYLPERRNSGPR